MPELTEQEAADLEISLALTSRFQSALDGHLPAGVSPEDALQAIRDTAFTLTPKPVVRSSMEPLETGNECLALAVDLERQAAQTELSAKQAEMLAAS